MKVLIYAIDFAPKIGGEETYLRSLGQGLISARDCDALLVTRTAANGFDDSSLPFPVVRQPRLTALWRLVGNADVVHLSGPVLLPMLIGLLRRKPIVIQHHMYHSICPNGVLLYAPTESPCPGHFMARRYHRCLECCAATSGWRQSVLMLLETFPRRWLSKKVATNLGVTRYVSDRIALPRGKTLLYGVPDHQATSQHPPAPRSPSTLRVAYVGRLVREKGLGLLLDAASSLKKEGRQFSLRIIGDGPERRHLESQVGQRSLQDHVEFTGFVVADALKSALADISVVVMPSICPETAGFAAIDQMMRGRLVVAADIGGLGEVVGDVGLKFPPGNAEALSACLRRVLDEPGLSEELGTRARARAIELFSERRMIQEHEDIYRELARAQRRPSSVPSRLGAGLFQPVSLLLLIIGLVIIRGQTQGDFHVTGDEARHAMNGVFVRDVLLDFPWRHPVQYAYDYYAKYPAIALPHWPPFFYVVEALFYMAFGVSVWTSRLTVLSFALLGVYFWYRIAERHGSTRRAVLSALVFSLLPFVLLYERLTMLDIPAVALCLAAINFWQRFLDTERFEDLWKVGAFSTAALLTHQSAIFLAPFLGLDLAVERRFRLLRRRDVWITLVICTAAVLAWYVWSFQTLSFSYERAAQESLSHNANPWDSAFYLGRVTQQMGWPLAILAGVGLGWAVWKAPRHYRFLIVWIVACFLCFTAIQEKDVRHTLIWLPPLVYFAVLGIEALVPGQRYGVWVSSGIALLIVAGSLRFETPKVGGMEEVARFVLSQAESDVLHYEGYLSGDFVFWVRKLDPQKRHLVTREKQVVVTQIVYAKRAVLKSPEEVLGFFRDWGIRYALVDNLEPPAKEFAPVFAVLLSEHFELVRTFPIWSRAPQRAGAQVSLYRFRGELHPADRPLVVPMMTIRSDIPVDLKRLAGRPWPN